MVQDRAILRMADQYYDLNHAIIVKLLALM